MALQNYRKKIKFAVTKATLEESRQTRQMQIGYGAFSYILKQQE